MRRTHIDLFSGIGGFALAARWNGIETVQFVEIDPFCQKVLQKNFPGVPIHDDIKTFTKDTMRVRSHIQWNITNEMPIMQDVSDGISDISEVIADTKCRRGKSREIQNRNINAALSGGQTDTRFTSDRPIERPFLLTGGFPCQPFSCAGKRKGTADDRHLWPEMLRVIKEFKPRWVIGENVAGIRSMELVNSSSAMEGNADYNEDGDNYYTTVLDGVCNDLEAIGYEVQPFVIPACAVNAPHRRDRVWIVGNSQRHRLNREAISVQSGESRRERLPGYKNESIGNGWEAREKCCGSSVDAADSEGKRGGAGLREDGPEQDGDKPTDSGGDAPYAQKRQDHERNGRGMDGTATGREGVNAAIGVGDTDVADTEQQRRWEHGDEQGRGNALETVRGGQWSTPWPEVAARLCRVDDGVAHRVDRLKALGNAIVPQVAAEIMKAIMEASNDNISESGAICDQVVAAD